MLNKNLTFTFNHKDQPDKLYATMSSDEIKIAFDSRAEAIKTYLYSIIDVLNTNAASNIAYDPDTNLKTKIDSIVDGLNRITNEVSFARLGKLTLSELTNELDTSITTLETLLGSTSLATSNKTITGAVNELKGGIEGLFIKVGNEALTTLNKNISGAINELKSMQNMIVEELNNKALKTHTHTKSQITDFPTRLSEFQNDIGAGGSEQSHSHANISTLNNITDFKVEEWDNKPSRFEFESLSNDVSNNTSQLAEITNCVSENKVTLNDTAVIKPLVTFIADDGSLADYTKMKPLFETKEIVGCSAIVSSYVGGNGNMTISQIKELENLGWEILSHSKTHIKLDTLSDEQLVNELENSKLDLISMGFDVNSIAIPFSTFDSRVRKFASRYYKSVFATMGTPNTVPINTHGLLRTPLGSYSSGAEYETLEYYKSRVDFALQNNAWLIFCVHPSATSDIQMGYWAETIDYIKSLGIEIVTVKQALKTFANVLESRNFESGEYSAIGKDGKVYSSSIVENQFDVLKYNNVKNNTPITDFPQNKTTVAPILSQQNAGFPTQTGICETFRPHSDFTDILGYQLWKPYNSIVVYRRYWNNGSWTEWIDLSVIQIDSANARNINTLVGDFPAKKITYTTITGSNASGFPGNRAGVLMTNRLHTSDNAFQWQEYKTYGTNNTYTRTTDLSGNWGSFVQLGKTTPITVTVPLTTVPASSVVEISLDVAGVTNLSNVSCMPIDAMNAGVTWSCYVSSVGVVKLRLANPTTSEKVLVERSWRVVYIN